MKKFFFDQKSSKNLYFWPFLGQKMLKTKIFGRKNFFGRNRFRMVQNVFKNENLDFEKNSILTRHSHFFQKMGPQVKKMAKTKIFGRFFLVGIDSEWSKTCFKTKISISKNFPIMTFHRGHSRFSKIGSHSSNHPLEPKELTRL